MTGGRGRRRSVCILAGWLRGILMVRLRGNAGDFGSDDFKSLTNRGIVRGCGRILIRAHCREFAYADIEILRVRGVQATDIDGAIDRLIEAVARDFTAQEDATPGVIFQFHAFVDGERDPPDFAVNLGVSGVRFAREEDRMPSVFTCWDAYEITRSRGFEDASKRAVRLDVFSAP